MTITPISGTITAQQVFAADGDMLIVETDANLLVDNNSAVTSTGFGFNSLVVRGLVASTNLSYSTVSLGTSTSSSITSISISATGQIQSGGTAIHVFGGGTMLVNDGVISAQDTGIWFSGSSQDVINNGSVAASNIGLQSASGDGILENNGSFYGLTTGIDVTSGWDIFNHGMISSPNSGIILHGGNNIINNFGTISAVTAISMTSASGGNEIHNAGTIVGEIQGNDGEDTFYNTGRIEGRVMLGGGGDFFSSRGGTVTGEIDGGQGDDVYEVDDIDLDLDESTNAGTDMVIASVSWVLGDDFENLELAGNTNLRGVGNSAANRLLGNSGDNLLKGLGGADTFMGSYGADDYRGGSGTDLIDFGRSGIAMSVNLSKGTLTGEGIEGSKVNSIEDASGGQLRDTLTGSNGANVLSGRDGADKVIGGKGNDILYGGADGDPDDFTDRFIFATGSDRDKIMDFDADGATHDVIDLAGMKSIASFSDLKKNHMEQVGSDVVIDAGGGDTITLVDTTLGDLKSSAFMF